MPYTYIYTNLGAQVVHLALEGFVPSSVFRQSILNVIEFIKAKGITAAIYDSRRMRSLPPQDQDWFFDEALPLLLKSQLRRVAVVEPSTGADTLNLNHMVYSNHFFMPFEMQYFGEVSSALEWIATGKAAKEEVGVAQQPSAVSASLHRQLLS
ncbi:STAS/SEC14 domain-containing protein [Rufibacter glacialis]|uniref:STAS/SEC14 domain-containing protein n=1 Tax=Rufibacter glacialis TaxID=1259555 RepID=A0A5M8Q8A1_9BACT|nr:STAS/SEC14 domain-containing protein [Rufibacter glacialis]KAA6431096.1 STAS/SEC14 domain-containing protein [Rufibacter glacialis]GGK83971.1 hypothetical protein GCM10011405_34860 [Rufibacter glacialis]